MNTDHDFLMAYTAYTRAHIEAAEEFLKGGSLWELTSAILQTRAGDWDDLAVLAVQTAETHTRRLEAVDWVRQGSSAEVLVLNLAIRGASSFAEIQPLITRIRKRIERLNESRRLFTRNLFDTGLRRGVRKRSRVRGRQRKTRRNCRSRIQTA